MIEMNDKKRCCGCSACYSACPKQCIEMKTDSEGFLYPIVDKEKCVDCGLCERVCPIINRTPEHEKPQSAYIVQNKDEKILKESTSGGAFTAIAEYVIDKGGVVFGGAFDSDFRVAHICVNNKADLAKFRNSKYVQSDVGRTFMRAKEFLDRERFVCYSGTPCQIEGLKHFLQKEYANLITVDVVCRAVPSPLIWGKYKHMRAGDNKLISSAFRSKEPYGYDYSQIKVETEQSSYRAGVESDPYLRAFFSNLSDRPSCYSCAFKKRYRQSDITLWDCFEPYKFDKTMDNNKGVTRVLIHTDAGCRLFNEVIQKLKYKAIEPEKLVDGVREMFYSVPCNPRREAFFNDAETMDDEAFFKKYFPDNVKVKSERFVRHISEKLGIYRIVKRMAKGLLKK